ncbi:hypothetical protein EI534_15815 [Pseudomonas frederiksbergensis]|nr:hypothetical protein [Pseudomonas frederiksbergensis]
MSADRSHGSVGTVNFVAHNFPRRFLQRTLLPRFGIDPYSSGSRKTPRTTLAGRIQERPATQHLSGDSRLKRCVMAAVRGTPSGVPGSCNPVGQPAYGCHLFRLAANGGSSNYRSYIDVRPSYASLPPHRHLRRR